MRRLSFVVLLTCIFCSVPSPTEAQQQATSKEPPAGDVDLAKAHYNTGEIYYAKGRFSDAAHEFEEAYRLSHRAALLYNMAMAYDKANDYARSLDCYGRFLSARPDDASFNDRPFAEERVQRLRGLVGRLSLYASVDGSSVRVDGRQVGTTPLQPSTLLVNPGQHTVEVEHEGYATWRGAAAVPVGGEVKLQAAQVSLTKLVTVQKQEAPVYKRWWLWTAVGGAGVVASAITLAVVLSHPPDSGVPTAQLPVLK
jgi:tetratricopeptide (TPR) repeat protein